MLRIISLGAGVQSSTLALMSARGLVGDVPDFSIFADTKAEPKSVYVWLDWLEKQLPFPNYRVSAGDLAADGLKVILSKKSGNRYQKNLIPLFIKNPDGSKGILQRKCTSEYKVRELIKKQRTMLAPGELNAWRKKTRGRVYRMAVVRKKQIAIAAGRVEGVARRRIGGVLDRHKHRRGFQDEAFARAVDTQSMAADRNEYLARDVFDVDGEKQPPETAAQRLHVLPVPFRPGMAATEKR